MLCDLTKTVTKFSNQPSNPTPRPRFILNFGSFDVEQVSNEA
jgi:hypothetical protein